MLKNISSFLAKQNSKHNKNILFYYKDHPLSNFCSDVEKFDPEKKPKLIIPIKINEPLMPYGNSLRIFGKDDPVLVDILKRYKEDYEKADKFAAFLYDKKKKKMVATGVQCNILNLEATGEISLISKSGDLRMQLINNDGLKFEGEYAEAIDVKDKESANKLIEYEFARNIVGDINKVILNCLSIVSKPMSPMESSLVRDLNSILIYLQGLLQSNTEFISSCTASQFGVNYPEGVHKLNSLIYKNVQEMLKIAKTIRKFTPFVESEEFLKCDDPVVRTRMLIDLVYTLGDYVIKELHMYEEYKKDTLQKQEKFYLRFVKKTIEKIAGSESYEDYKNKFDLLVKDNELTSQAKRSIEVELELAGGNNQNDGFEMEDRKKFGIVEEIFTFPWNKRDKIEFDLQHARDVFESSLYGMNKVKERVYEYIAKLKRTQLNTKKGFVILITGPPGTGKTTVAQLIGKALKRKTAIINLSGESDSITLKGSRRTYVDSQPSIFFKEMVKLGVKNPVIVLDEIDKLTASNSHKSHTASSALLELLNPDENHNFIDQYLNVPLDFSEVIFICTSNYTMQILEPLLDRVEVIEIDDYTFQDKKEITEKFLIPSTLKDFGYSYDNKISNSNDSTNANIEFSQEAITKLIKLYSSPHGGVRGIKKHIEKLIRKANMLLIQNKQSSNLIIDENYLDKFLGNSKTNDVNFLNLVNNYDQPGTCLTADMRGYLVKLMIRKKACSKEVDESILNRITQSKKITSKDILHKINMIVKLEKYVEEALQISVNLAKYKLVDLYNEGRLIRNPEILGDFMREYNLYLSMPYQKKEGNSYGLSFYISLLSAVLNIRLNPGLLKSLIVGELSPFGNVLKVRDIKHALSICEFYDIKNVILPEGNKEEFIKYMEHSNKSFDHVFFVKTAGEAFDILLAENLKTLGKQTDTNKIKKEDVNSIGENVKISEVSVPLH